MEIITKWKSCHFHTPSDYIQFLWENPPSRIPWVPPTLKDMDTILRIREDYLSNSLDRESLTEELTLSHRRRNAPASSLANIQKLKSGDAFLIIAGQQPGLLGGPMYTFYKIAQACNLAARLSREHSAIFIPAFWNAAEDHDFPEIATLFWLSHSKEVQSFTWPGEPRDRRPLYAIKANECPVESLIQHIRETTFPTEFSDEVFNRIQKAQAESESYPDLIDKLIWSLFQGEGLVILRPDDLFVRKNAAPFIKKEILEPAHNALMVEKAGYHLREHGLAPQIHKRLDRTAFFLLENNQRNAIYFNANLFTSESGATYTQEQLLEILQNKPDSFSPAAVLRPIIQDAVFPNAASILGPSEIAYHFLLDMVYGWHGVPRPMAVPRTGYTLCDKKDEILMDKFSLTPASIKGDISSLLKRFKREEDGGNLAQYRDKTETVIAQYFELLVEKAETVDPTIVAVLQKNKNRIFQEIHNSEDLVFRRAGGKDETGRKKIEGLRATIYPNENFQERTFNIFFYLMKYGPDFLVQFKAATENTDEGNHYFMLIP